MAAQYRVHHRQGGSGNAFEPFTKRTTHQRNRECEGKHSKKLMLNAVSQTETARVASCKVCMVFGSERSTSFGKCRSHHRIA